MAKSPLEIKQDLDYLMGKINFGASALDADAITIMNSYGFDLSELQQVMLNQIGKLCVTCKHFGSYTLHACDGGLTGCKELNIENSDRRIGGCILHWKAKD